MSLFNVTKNIIRNVSEGVTGHIIIDIVRHVIEDTVATRHPNHLESIFPDHNLVLNTVKRSLVSHWHILDLVSQVGRMKEINLRSRRTQILVLGYFIFVFRYVLARICIKVFNKKTDILN